jgi:hypothetical protein
VNHGKAINDIKNILRTILGYYHKYRVKVSSIFDKCRIELKQILNKTETDKTEILNQYLSDKK